MSLLGHYLFLSASGYLTAVLCMVLALLVLHANPKSKSCRLAFLFNVSVGLWAFFFATMFLSKDDALGMFVCQMVSFCTVLLSTFITHFVLVQVKLESGRKRFICLNYLASGLLIILIFIPHLIISGSPPKLSLPSYINGGPFYSLIPFQLFFNFFYSAYHLILGIKKARGYKRNQLLLFLIALFTGYLSGTPSYLLVYNIPSMPITAPFVSLYPIILTYAIMKHRFLDIQKLVKNTLIFSLLFVVLMACVSLILVVLRELFSQRMGMPEAVAQAVAIALAIAFYGPLKKFLLRLTHRLLFQHSENPETVFRKLSEDLLHYLQPGALAATTASRLAETLALERTGFYLRSSLNPSVFELVASAGRMRKKQLSASKQIIQYLERTREVLVHEAKGQAAFELAALGGIAAIPIFVRENLRAVLILGRKKSDAPWRDE